MINIGNSWDDILKDEFEKEYYKDLRRFLYEEYTTRTIYPDMNDIFNALRTTAYEDVKCVILGQDPYHGEGQAHGYAFSVPKGVALPPSLRNIFKDGDLRAWAKRGVLLLNTCLTVRAGQAGSHRGRGWEILTDKIISLISQREKPCTFILWGNPARAKKALIDKNKHLIVEGVHPSPLSAHRGFFGGGYFVRVNKFLEESGEKPIDWRLD